MRLQLPNAVIIVVSRVFFDRVLGHTRTTPFGPSSRPDGGGGGGPRGGDLRSAAVPRSGAISTLFLYRTTKYRRRRRLRSRQVFVVNKSLQLDPADRPSVRRSVRRLIIPQSRRTRPQQYILEGLRGRGGRLSAKKNFDLSDSFDRTPEHIKSDPGRPLFGGTCCVHVFRVTRPPPGNWGGGGKKTRILIRIATNQKIAVQKWAPTRTQAVENSIGVQKFNRCPIFTIFRKPPPQTYVENDGHRRKERPVYFDANDTWENRGISKCIRRTPRV